MYDKAEIIVARILADLSDRRGIGDEWEASTDEVKLAIAERLIELTKQVINGDLNLSDYEESFTLASLAENAEEEEEEN